MALIIFVGRAGDDILAVAAYYRRSIIPSPRSDRKQPAAAEPRSGLAAEILRPRAAGQSAGQAPGRARRAARPVPAVAQRVVLYEEDPNDPQGKRYVGSVIWRTETVSPGPGLAPELAVRADVEIPERHITMTWSLRRNTDQALPASHTIEIMFNLPADFPGGGIANVPGILMKQSEQARGTPLAGLAVKVTNGFFLIGLSAVDTDMQRNIQLLKERPWFDIPIVYTNGGRAILAMEKGPARRPRLRRCLRRLGKEVTPIAAAGCRRASACVVGTGCEHECEEEIGRRERCATAAPQPFIASALRTLGDRARGLGCAGGGHRRRARRAPSSLRSRPFAQARGRLIVTGMGKSGHIARKIAATLASTGTPAFFVHAADASHGDLGMITSDDVMLVLSWSGETGELRSVIDYSRRFGITLIAVTVSAESTLGKAADIVLALPPAREACPHNLTPTTSTLMQLALGDALAIALLESRGFTAVDFGVFHPRRQARRRAEIHPRRHASGRRACR